MFCWNEFENKSPDESEGSEGNRQKPLDWIQTPLDYSDGLSSKSKKHDLHHKNYYHYSQEVSGLKNPFEDIQLVVKDSCVDKVENLKHNKGVKDVSHMYREFSSFLIFVAVHFEAVYYQIASWLVLFGSHCWVQETVSSKYHDKNDNHLQNGLSNDVFDHHWGDDKIGLFDWFEF